MEVLKIKLFNSIFPVLTKTGLLLEERKYFIFLLLLYPFVPLLYITPY